ncbi:structural protein [Erwinia phage Tian]|uniref:Cyanophage baseplate Pam3 plug gp18 domain-containing protein n=4 Tax=Caudoviricetes TaxID=2731619 RepID=A0A6B9RGI6_9CAUD|nr:hypothetical protein SUNLIREN_84 [Erwinia phage SunLIRen]QGF21795.1 hypothetical protein [Salmonella phage ST-3]QHI00607.1 hypothetical protein [Salmonella phage vB_SenM_SB18]UFD98411.1 hypothetical protein SPARTY_88 [Hafnia phage vB_HalM_SPARTY]UXD79862.1 hypothetical protein 4Roscha1_00055 [Erwinia phage Roscha1]WJN64388.1 structural protein [Erwinia phage Panisse]WJN64687.1 structural protein [Erwinia phage Pistou]WJN64966.1 structural protein [Erwinia phage Tian]
MSNYIPVPDSEWSTQTVTLDKIPFLIELRFKSRQERWYLTIKDTDGNILISEVKCVPNTTLTGRYGLPEIYGDIFVERFYGSSEYPTRNNFGIGKEFGLVYQPLEEQ